MDTSDPGSRERPEGGGTPVLAWDGDCRFCAAWVARWRHATGASVEYVRVKDLGERLPGLDRARLAGSVALVEPDGRTSWGAEAVARALAAGGRPWMLRAHEHVPGFARAAAIAYRFVARRRRAFSRATLALWGEAGPATTFRASTWLFVRLLGLVLVAAFASLWPQLHGLVGEAGILPVADHLASLERHVGPGAWRVAPTLLWLGASDGALDACCAAGMACAVLVVLGVAPVPSLAGAWACYLSLAVAGQDFLSFQWDALLLEATLLAILLAPLALTTPARRWAEPRALARIALAYLLFRVMFLSGVVKLASGDPAWRDLSAMDFHYLTQPLPNPVAWLAWRLPPAVHRVETIATFVVELALPLAIVLPRRPRMAAFWGFVALQAVIFATGNYGWFNLLVVALCVLLVDDASMPAAIRRRFVPAHDGGGVAQGEGDGGEGDGGEGDGGEGDGGEGSRDQVGAGASIGASPRKAGDRPRSAGQGRRWPRAVVVPLAAAAMLLATVSATRRLGVRVPWPRPLVRAHAALAPFSSFNAYGLFAVMTTERREIVFEGSDDGVTWHAYVLRWQPGPVGRMPPVVAPHMPRLDWQMWFAALGGWRSPGNEWVQALMGRLLEGSPEVTALFARNPFPDAPPRHVRAVVHDYRFSTWDELRREGRWWTRTEIGPWSPVLSRRER